MIIRYPTGLYSRQIPSSPSEAGNITFTISNEEPLSLGQDFLIFPVAEQLKKRAPKAYDTNYRRSKVGDLVYTVTFGGYPIDGNSAKVFEVGQVLEFTDQVLPSVSVNVTPDKIEIQHNTNVIDLSEFGLTQDEISSVTIDAASIKDQIESQITTIQNSIADKKAQITDLQKKINEANKALSAVGIIEGSGVISEKIIQSRNIASEQQIITINEVEELNSTLTSLVNELLAVSQLVR